MPDPDLSTLIEDVKIIKNILQNEDAAFPRIWRLVWGAATAIALAGLLQYFVPFFRAMDFDGRLLWLWFPGFCLVFPLGLVFLYTEVRRTGSRFLGQGRFRHLLFARFVIPPAALVLLWTASRNPVFSLEGTFLLIAAIWLTAIEQAVPNPFRIVPLGFLTLGLIELGFHLTGPETTLVNTLLVSGALTFAGLLFWTNEKRRAETAAPGAPSV